MAKSSDPVTTSSTISKIPPSSPPPSIQRINALLHKEPYSFIMYGFYWSFFFMIAGPLVALFLQFRLVVQLIIWSFRRVMESRSEQSSSTASENSSPPSTGRLGVVITGCDSGFGKEIALRAAQEGYTVFAGCLRKESVEEYAKVVVGGSEGGQILPILMDVTKDESVRDAVRSVQQWLAQTNSNGSGNVLHALLNNAGVGKVGEVDWLDMRDFEFTMEVNYLGMVRCCKAFLPIFKEQVSSQHPNQHHSNARILNLISMAGMVSGGAGLSAYHASKHAAQAFTTCLRQELHAFGIHVSAIHPTFHKTPIVETMYTVCNQLWDNLSPKLKEEYGQEFFERFLILAADLPHSSTWDMNVVIDSVLGYLSDRVIPPREVIIGTDGRYVSVLLRMLPVWFIEPLLLMVMQRPVPAMIVKRK